MPAALIRDGSEYIYGTERISVDDIRWIIRASFPSVSVELASILNIARDQLAAAAAAAEYVDDWWASGGAPIVMITVAQDIDKTEAEGIADRWLERRAKGPAYPAVLGKGATAAPFGASMATGDATSAQDRLLASVARYLGVPASYVNVPSFAGSLTYQNVEQAGLDLVRYTFSAYADPIGDAISELLPGDYLGGRAVRLDLSHLTRGGQLERYQAYESALRAGWITKPEVRQAEGLPPIDEDELPAPPAELPAPEPVLDEVPA
jgi:HK97 family phage portal protein